MSARHASGREQRVQTTVSILRPRHRWGDTEWERDQFHGTIEQPHRDTPFVGGHRERTQRNAACLCVFVGVVGQNKNKKLEDTGQLPKRGTETSGIGIGIGNMLV